VLVLGAEDEGKGERGKAPHLLVALGKGEDNKGNWKSLQGNRNKKKKSWGGRGNYY